MAEGVRFELTRPLQAYRYTYQLAVRGGFEPPIALQRYLFSRQAQSSTLPSHRKYARPALNTIIAKQTSAGILIPHATLPDFSPLILPNYQLEINSLTSLRKFGC
jgi:hypothetical protein